ncbi:hypothetical protein VXI05_004450 [Vibrio parahaemolyticus]|nr:hypothetical protein [Vibrio parahaemolyticus]
MKLFSTEEFNSGIKLLSDEHKNNLLNILKFLTDNGQRKIKESPKVVSVSNEIYSFLGEGFKVYFKIEDNKLFLINFVLSESDECLNDYLNIMQSVNLSISEINKSIRQKYPSVSIYAQLRLVLELISKSWLAVNRDMKTKSKNAWNVNQIILSLSKENANFYQQPVEHDDADSSKLVTKKSGYLSLDEFKSVYSTCNEKIHTSVKEEEGDYVYIQGVVNRLNALLDTHIIYPKNQEMLYFVGMRGRDNKPFGNIFKKA